MWALRAGALAAEAVMAGGHPLVLNRFSKKQAAASTGAMARVQKAQRVSFCDLAEITRGTYVRVTDGSEEQVRRTTAADALATRFSPCLLLGAERPAVGDRVGRWRRFCRGRRRSGASRSSRRWTPSSHRRHSSGGR